MVKVDAGLLYSEEDKPMNPNDLLLSMFANIASPGSSGHNAHSNEEFAQSLLRSILSKPLNSSNHTNELVQSSNAAKAIQRDNTSLSALNPALASALGMITSEKPKFRSIARIEAQENEPIARRRSGPVKLEGEVVPLHIQRHAEGNLDLPSSHVVSYNGHQTEVPDEIRCHLCNYPMKMCYRKSKYKSEIREYPAYRCLRKGCQTFRAIRKVLEPETQLPSETSKRKVAAEETPSVLRDILSTPSFSELPSAKQRKVDKNGTLVYLPYPMTPDQIARLQKAAFEILNEDRVIEQGEVLSMPLIVSTSMTQDEVSWNQMTEEGQQILRRELIAASMELNQAYEQTSVITPPKKGSSPETICYREIEQKPVISEIRIKQET